MFLSPDDFRSLKSKNEKLEIPTARFSLVNLMNSTGACTQCRNDMTRRLHDVIKTRFDHVLNKCFRQVPSYPELLVFETESCRDHHTAQV